MVLVGEGHRCLQSVAVLQQAPAVPKVDLAAQLLLYSGDAAVQGVLFSPAVTSGHAIQEQEQSQGKESPLSVPGCLLI